MAIWVAIAVTVLLALSGLPVWLLVLGATVVLVIALVPRLPARGGDERRVAEAFARAVEQVGLARTFMTSQSMWARPVTESQVHVQAVEPHPYGWFVDVAVWFGMDWNKLQRHAPGIASSLATQGLQCASVQLDPHPDSAGHGRVWVISRDALKETRPWTPPAHPSIWDAIEVGWDQTGQPATVTIPDRSGILLGGEPSSGKSKAAALLTAHAAAAHDASLWALDYKELDLAPWEPYCEGFATKTPAANELLAELVDLANRRQTELRALGLQKIQRDLGWPVHVLVIDELALFLRAGTDRASQSASAVFQTRLFDLVARCRALGLFVVASIQKPTVETVGDGRDLFSFRWAMRCTTRDASDTILSRGMAASGYDASKISLAQRGVGWLLAEGDRPRLCRALWLDDEQLHRLTSQPKGCALPGREVVALEPHAASLAHANGSGPE
jgi:hypothetical protein